MSFIRKQGTDKFLHKTLEVPHATLFLVGQPTIDKTTRMMNLVFELRASNNRLEDNLLHPRYLEINLYDRVVQGMRASESTPEGGIRIQAVCSDIPAAWGRGELPDGWPTNVFAQGYFLGGLLDQLEEWESDEPKPAT